MRITLTAVTIGLLAIGCLKRNHPLPQTSSIKEDPANFVAADLNCAIVAQSENEDIGDFFIELEGQLEQRSFWTEEYKRTLLRKSVAAFHGDLGQSTSDDMADELGEGVYFSLVKDKRATIPEGKPQEYVAVSVGFGGGNGASYYFPAGGTNFVPVMSEDGDCVDQGSSRTFPIETEIRTAETDKHSLECTVTSGTSPIKGVRITTRLFPGSNTYYGYPLYLSPRKFSREELAQANPDLHQKVEAGLKLKMPKFRRDNDPSVYLSVDRDSPDRAPIPRLFGQMNIDGDAPVRANGITFSEGWTANLSVGVKGSTLSISGKLYPHRVGGFWSEDAIEFRAEGTCNGTITVTAVKYHRVVKY